MTYSKIVNNFRFIAVGAGIISWTMLSAWSLEFEVRTPEIESLEKEARDKQNYEAKCRDMDGTGSDRDREMSCQYDRDHGA